MNQTSANSKALSVSSLLLPIYLCLLETRSLLDFPNCYKIQPPLFFQSGDFSPVDSDTSSLRCRIFLNSVAYGEVSLRFISRLPVPFITLFPDALPSFNKTLAAF